MMRAWQREIIHELNKTANLECTCENNGDYCPRCDARLQLEEMREDMRVLIREADIQKGGGDYAKKS